MSAGQFFECRIQQNVITISGDLRLESMPRLSSALHQVVHKSRYPDVILNFSNRTSITHSVIPPVAAQLRRMVRDEKIEFEYLPPRDASLASRIMKLGLAHYIEHRRYSKPRMNSSDPSLLQFFDQDER